MKFQEERREWKLSGLFYANDLVMQCRERNLKFVYKSNFKFVKKLKSRKFSVHMDESAVRNGEVPLLAYIRYIEGFISIIKFFIYKI